MAPSAYSPEQITQYLDYIGLPSHYHPSSPSRPPLSFDFLTTLHAHQIAAIPYENLSLHYSVTKEISIDPQVTFKKIVTDKRGRGGYCMEAAIFFNHILRALGFDAYTAGVRIRYRENGIPKGDYIGWTHIVNIVTLPDSTKHVLDVAFGGDGPTKPLPLLPGIVTSNIGTQELRFVHEPLAQQTHDAVASKYWIYQYRNAPTAPWNSFYAFTELEFLHGDFEIMNHFTSTSKRSFQTYTALVVKFLMAREGDEEMRAELRAEGKGKGGVYGKVMLVGGDVKVNTDRKTRVVKRCETEAERVKALREWFGMSFTEEEREGIRGHVTELK
ncbi:arylamine N-acetyltransferase 1 [Mytilinidion resinicola]|uniref:Arylamine N-acetyltransferase 1 n=1 Tax=Mytilinidion resinicola TaxID=574789 RepID=A0A6A6Z0B6_9PEZI|nr:arylamine N-acetyltransferase 1 [Mytilinidion resinicola]KAF2814450.1 arylamine N-acetyltransferase 1 [Mytilinidion resinicola]